MATIKAVDADKLDADLVKIANAVREKAGTSSALDSADLMVAALDKIQPLPKGTTIFGPKNPYAVEANTAQIYNDYLYLFRGVTDPTLLEKTEIQINLPAESLGTATRADVRKGVKFTSKSGLAIDGEMEETPAPAPGGAEVKHFVSDGRLFDFSTGWPAGSAVKVWGWAAEVPSFGYFQVIFYADKYVEYVGGDPITMTLTVDAGGKLQGLPSQSKLKYGDFVAVKE